MQNPPRQALHGYIFAMLAACCWAMLGPVAKLPLSHGIGPMEVAFWRAAFGACFFITHGLIRGFYHVKAKDAAAIAAFGVVGVALMFYIYQVAVLHSGAAMAAVLLYTAPLWVAVFARVIFKESLTPLKLAAIMTALAGVALVCLSGGGMPQKADAIGVACGLLTGFTYSLHYIFGAIYLKKISSITLYMYCLPVGALLMLPLVHFAPKSPADWAALVSLGFIPTYAAYFLYCEGLKRLQPTRVAVVCNLEPLVATFLGFALWGELFPPAGWVGTVLVLAAVFMVMADKK